MPKLPNADQAVIAPEKIIQYLLDHDHPRGGPKATFFESFGFTLHNWKVLRDALLEHCVANPILRTSPGISGMKYEISGPMLAPDGRMLIVKAVWVIDTGETSPRFVTAVPD